MRTNGYYLIKPRPALLEKISGMDELSADVLTEVQLWESTEGDRTLWRDTDYCLRAKMAFLICLRSDYGRIDGVRSIIGYAKMLSADLFDKFWSIEQVDLKANVDEISLSALDLAEIQSTESELVNEWLSSRQR